MKACIEERSSLARRPDDGRHPGSPESGRSSRIGRWTVCLRSIRSGGFFQDPRARIDDHGCSSRVELGLDRRRSRIGNDERFLGLGALGRCACSLAREGTCWSASAGWNERAARTPLAHADPSSEEPARRMGQSVSWLRPANTCEVRRPRRVCPRFVSCGRSRSTTPCPKTLSALITHPVNGG